MLLKIVPTSLHAAARLLASWLLRRYLLARYLPVSEAAKQLTKKYEISAKWLMVPRYFFDDARSPPKRELASTPRWDRWISPLF